MIYGELITAEILKANLDKSDWLVFDCRFDLADATKAESLYHQSHVPGAYYAHLESHLSSPITAETGRHPLPDAQKFAHWLSSCGFDGRQQVVVYDDSFGSMASRLWWLLKCFGHDKVALLDGGWQAWQAKGYKVDGRVPESRSSLFSGRLNDSCVVSTEEVEENCHHQRFQLIDVRAAERYRGELEPIDPVAGHIPGAINVPLTDNLDPSGFFKSPQQLRALYNTRLGQFEDDKVVFMCGSGVTACHSLLAMVVAGYSMPRLYAGSWSEWIRDPARPLATSQ